MRTLRLLVAQLRPAGHHLVRSCARQVSTICAHAGAAQTQARSVGCHWFSWMRLESCSAVMVDVLLSSEGASDLWKCLARLIASDRCPLGVPCLSV